MDLTHVPNTGEDDGFQDGDLCGALGASGKKCRRPATINGRCWEHPDKPNNKPIVHGGASIKLPIALASRYQEAMSDPRKLSLEKEIALTSARIWELGESLQEAEFFTSGWEEATRALIAYMANPSENQSSLNRCMDILENGTKEVKKWNEIHANMEMKRKLTETEVKHILNIEQTLTAQEANGLIAAVIGVVLDEEPDSRIRTRIANRLAELSYLGTHLRNPRGETV